MGKLNKMSTANRIIFIIVCAVLAFAFLPGVSALTTLYVTNQSGGFSINAQGANNAVDIWGNETEFWISDVNDKLVYHYWRNGTYIDNFSTFGVGMRGICGNATNFVMYPLDTNVIYITTISGTSIANLTNGGYANGQIRTEGIWCNDTNIYSADYSAVRSVFNVQKDGTYVNNFSTKSYSYAIGDTSGIVGNIGNGNFLIASYNNNNLYYVNGTGCG